MLPTTFYAAEATIPCGYVSVDIKPSKNGTTYTISQLSVPLEPNATITGAATGKISAVAAGTISNGSAGWSGNALANATAPKFVKITSGAAEGRIFKITGNTANALTVDTGGTDLTSLGIVAGTDTYRIVSGFTLKGLFGTTEDGVVGGTEAAFTANQIDKVLISDAAGTTTFYYFNTDSGQWRVGGSPANQDNLAIAPYAGMSYYRISTQPSSLLFTGTVPESDARIVLPAAGTGIVASYFPVDTTLAQLGFQSMTGWRKIGDAGVTLATTDRVLVEDKNGLVFSYYLDGATWKRAGSAVDQGATVIPAGSAIQTKRFEAGSSAVLARTLPYDLN